MDTNLLNNPRLARMLIFFLLMASLFFLAKFINEIKASSYIGASAAATNTIVVNGTGNVFAVPDIATIDFTLDGTAATVKDAQDALSQKTDKALALVKADGVADADVQTTAYNSNPTYSTTGIVCVAYPCPQPSQTITGYDVSQTNEIKVRDTNAVSKILSDLATVSGIQVSGPNFTFDDPSITQAQARTKAIADAEGNAKELAKELGVRLVRIVSFSENGNGPIYEPKALTAMSASGSATPAPELPTGQNEVTSNVTITYEIN